jgi:hypothetical protein
MQDYVYSQFMTAAYFGAVPAKEINGQVFNITNKQWNERRQVGQ